MFAREESGWLIVTTDNDEELRIGPDAVSAAVAAVKDTRAAFQRAEKVLARLVGYVGVMRPEWVSAEAVELVGELGGSEKAGGGSAPAPKERQAGMAAQIMSTLATHPEGIAQLDLRAEIAKGPLGEKMKRSLNSFYNGVLNLEQAGKLVRHRGFLFTPPALDAFRDRVRRGEIADHPEVPVREITMADVAAQFIHAHPEGVTPAQIVKHMMVGGYVKTATSVYNALTKVLARDLAKREGKLYFPSEDNSPRTGKADGGE